MQPPDQRVTRPARPRRQLPGSVMPCETRFSIAGGSRQAQGLLRRAPALAFQGSGTETKRLSRCSGQVRP